MNPQCSTSLFHYETAKKSITPLLTTLVCVCFFFGLPVFVCCFTLLYA